MMSRAADEMAAKVAAAEEIEKQLLSGTQIIELDPDQLEASFVIDRLDDDELSLKGTDPGYRGKGPGQPNPGTADTRFGRSISDRFRASSGEGREGARHQGECSS